MSLFADKEATVEIHHPSWPPDQKVIVRRDMPYGARRAIEQSMFRIRAGKSGEVDMEGELAAMQMETLRQMIVSWTLTDDAGTPVPLSAEAIDQLRHDVASYIYREISRMHTEPTEEEQADFGGELAPGSTDVVPLPKRRSS